MGAANTAYLSGSGTVPSDLENSGSHCTPCPTVLPSVRTQMALGLALCERHGVISADSRVTSAWSADVSSASQLGLLHRQKTQQVEQPRTQHVERARQPGWF